MRIIDMGKERLAALLNRDFEIGCWVAIPFALTAFATELPIYATILIMLFVFSFWVLAASTIVKILREFIVRRRAIARMQNAAESKVVLEQPLAESTAEEELPSNERLAAGVPQLTKKFSKPLTTPTTLQSSGDLRSESRVDDEDDPALPDSDNE
mmetsp:Transcript_38299/g.93870  ORF Transcript_38299/g.93870 Transcript_38299/m.93870 type:complete len:155 (+) Transcript_38299:846-1310(+)